MKNIITIAKNTFRETIRDKILYGILAFAFIFLVATIFLGSISLGEDLKVIKDLGLAGIYVFSIIITIFLGTALIYKELEKRTVYIIFSKPVSKLEFALGKFFGLWASLIINVLLMSVIYLIIVAWKGAGFDILSVYSILLLIFELALFIALTILLSSLTAPLAGAIYSIIVLYIGHTIGIFREVSQDATPVLKGLANAVYYVMPNLEKFNLRNSVVHNITPDALDIIYPIIYSIVYSIILLWLATIVLKHQDY